MSEKMSYLMQFIEKIAENTIKNNPVKNVLTGNIKTIIGNNIYEVTIIDGDNTTSSIAQALSSSDIYIKDDQIYLIQLTNYIGENKDVQYAIVGKVAALEAKYRTATKKERFKVYKKISKNQNNGEAIEAQSDSETTENQNDVTLIPAQYNISSISLNSNENIINTELAPLFFEGLKDGKALFISAKVTAPSGVTRETDYGLKIELLNAEGQAVYYSLFGRDYFEGIPELLSDSAQSIVIDYKNILNLNLSDINKIRISRFRNDSGEDLGSYSNVILKAGAVLLEEAKLSVDIAAAAGYQDYFTPARGSLPAVDTIPMRATTYYDGKEINLTDMEYLWFREEEDKTWVTINPQRTAIFLTESNTEEVDIYESQNPYNIHKDALQNFENKIKCRAVYGDLEAESKPYTIYNYNKYEDAISTVLTSNSNDNQILFDGETITLTASVTNRNNIKTMHFEGYEWYYITESGAIKIPFADENSPVYNKESVKIKVDQSVSEITLDSEGNIKIPKTDSYSFIRIMCKSKWTIIEDNTGSIYEDSSNWQEINIAVAAQSEIKARKYYRYFISPSMSVSFSAKDSDIISNIYLPSQDKVRDADKTYYRKDGSNMIAVEAGDAGTNPNEEKWYELYHFYDDWNIIEPKYKEATKITEDNFNANKKNLFYKNSLGNYVKVASTDSYNEKITYYTKTSLIRTWKDTPGFDTESWKYIAKEFSLMRDFKGNSAYIYYTAAIVWSERVENVEQTLRLEGWTKPAIVRQVKKDGEGNWSNYREGAAAEKINTFNDLTKNGTDQGIFYNEGEKNGDLYINASYIQTGALTIGDGKNTVFSADKDSETVTIGGFDVNATSIYKKNTDNSDEVIIAPNQFQLGDGLSFTRLNNGTWRGSISGSVTIGSAAIGDGTPSETSEYTLADLSSPDIIEDYVFYAFTDKVDSELYPLTVTVKRAENDGGTDTIEITLSDNNNNNIWHYPRRAFLTSKQGGFSGIADGGGYNYTDPSTPWIPWSEGATDKYVWKTQVQVYKYYDNKETKIISGRRNAAVSQPILMTAEEAYQAAANEVIKGGVYAAYKRKVSSGTNIYKYYDPKELYNSETKDNSSENNIEIISKGWAFSSKGEKVSNVTVEEGNLTRWCMLYGKNIIEGGSIIAGSITGDRIEGNTLSAIKANLGTIKAGLIESKNYVSGISGLQLDLTNGTVDITGKITAKGGKIGGFTLDTSIIFNKVTDPNPTNSYGTGMSATEYTDDPAFWAGYTGNGNNPWEAEGSWSSQTKFYVTNAGKLVSTFGEIGGWTIDSNFIIKGESGSWSGMYGGSVTKTETSTGTTYNGFHFNGNPIRFFAGSPENGTPNGFCSAKFFVTENGYLHSSMGKIGDFKIENGSLISENILIKKDQIQFGLSNKQYIQLTPLNIYLYDTYNYEGTNNSVYSDFSIGRAGTISNGQTYWQGVYRLKTNHHLWLEAGIRGELRGTWELQSGAAITSWRGAKHDIESLPDTYSALFDNLKPVRFKYNNGQSDRYHTGFLLDELKDAMDAASIDTSEFAAYCVSNVETGEGGIRYEELIALNVAEIQKLKKQVSELTNELNALKTQQND